MLSSITVGNGVCNTKQFYIKMIAFEMLLVVSWWIIVMFDLSDNDLVYWIGARIVFTLFGTFILPSTFIKSLSNDYNSHFLLQKFKIIKKVLIPKEHKKFMEDDTEHAPKYAIVGIYTRDNTKHKYWKLKTKNWCCLKLFSRVRCSFCGIMHVRMRLANILFVKIPTFTFSVYLMYICWYFERIDTNILTNYNFLLVTLYVLVNVFYWMLTSLFARFQILVLTLFFAIVYLGQSSLFKYEQDTQYYGVIDELNILPGGAVTPITELTHVLLMWFVIVFSLAAAIFYIKFSPNRYIEKSYNYQLNSTILGIFSGLLDYTTDLLLIFYWITSNLYLYACIEIFFIIFAQLLSVLYINDTYFENKEKKIQSTKNSTSTCSQKIRKQKRLGININPSNILMNVFFGIGWGKIYHSIKKWETAQNEIQYKLCKLLELMFESMPSVVLSVFVTLKDESNLNASLIVSLIFSLINITNTIVNVVNKDHMEAIKDANNKPTVSPQTSVEQQWSEIVAMNDNHGPAVVNKAKSNDIVPPVNSILSMEIMVEGTINSTDNKNCNVNPNANSNTNSPKTYMWVINPLTKEAEFRHEEQYPKSGKKQSKKETCCGYLKTMSKVTFRFEANLQNFAIWVFLTSDLFVRILSILSLIVLIDSIIENNSISVVIISMFVICLLLFEYKVFNGLLNYNSENILIKYFIVGVFSNSFYFILSIGLKYIPTLISFDKFICNQIKFRICISLLLVMILYGAEMMMQMWKFGINFLVLYVLSMAIHVISLVYIIHIKYVRVSN